MLHLAELLPSDPSARPCLLDLFPYLGKLRGLISTLLLKDLTFGDGVLEVLLHLAHPGLMPVSSGLHRQQLGNRFLGRCFLRRRLLFGLLKFGLEVLDLRSAGLRLVKPLVDTIKFLVGTFELPV